MAARLPFGRYRLQVLQANGGMAASSVVFYAGWAIGDNPDVPARVSVRAGAEHYKPGDTAVIHVEAPYAGPATVLVMTDRVKKLIDLTPSSASFDVSIPVTADWGPGAYVGVHVFRPGGTDPDTKAAASASDRADLGGAGPSPAQLAAQHRHTADLSPAHHRHVRGEDDTGCLGNVGRSR